MQVKKIKPKEYTHIDYEALLIYIMKNGVSLEQALEDNGLTIARSTFTRNINKILEKNEDNEVIGLYRDEYSKERQKGLSEPLKQKIAELPDKKIVNKVLLEDLYKKLTMMKAIIESCGGSMKKAVEAINTGNTPLGQVQITRQGLKKNMEKYEEVRNEYLKQIANKMLERE